MIKTILTALTLTAAVTGAALTTAPGAAARVVTMGATGIELDCSTVQFRWPAGHPLPGGGQHHGQWFTADQTHGILSSTVGSEAASRMIQTNVRGFCS